jgi:hypothetical protein
VPVIGRRKRESGKRRNEPQAEVVGDVTDGTPTVSSSQAQSDTADQVDCSSVDSLLTPERMEILARFADQAYLRYVKSSPCLTHLPTVIHVNVLNALAMNAAALGLSDIWLLCDSLSPFG